MEGGQRATAYPSGLAAVAGSLLTAVGAGDHLLMTDNCYGPTRRFCDHTLARMGVSVDYFDPTAGAAIEAQMRPNTGAVYMESPGSLSFEVADFPKLGKRMVRTGKQVEIYDASDAQSFGPLTR